MLLENQQGRETVRLLHLRRHPAESKTGREGRRGRDDRVECENLRGRAAYKNVLEKHLYVEQTLTCCLFRVNFFCKLCKRFWGVEMGNEVVKL